MARGPKRKDRDRYPGGQIRHSEREPRQVGPTVEQIEQRLRASGNSDTPTEFPLLVLRAVVDAQGNALISEEQCRAGLDFATLHWHAHGRRKGAVERLYRAMLAGGGGGGGDGSEPVTPEAQRKAADGEARLRRQYREAVEALKSAGSWALSVTMRVCVDLDPIRLDGRMLGERELTELRAGLNALGRQMHGVGKRQRAA